MTTIHFVRHGQTHWNLERRIQGQTESQLTDLGREQASAAGLLLKDVPFDVAFSSSSDRARNTAELILKHHQLPLHQDDDLREIFLGPWEGNLYDEIMISDPDQHNHFWHNPDKFSVAGAESFFDLQQRATSAVEKIAKEHQGKNILIVSHGCWIKSVLTFLQKRDMAHFWLPPKMTNCCHSIIQSSQPVFTHLHDFNIAQFGNEKSW